MSRNETRFTVLLQPPFWVGIAERWEEGRYQAARIPFGGEPTDAQILQWLEREGHRLRFSPPQRAEETAPLGHQNPKRTRREAARAVERRGLGTKAQQALSAQREQEGETRRTRSREDRQA